MKRNLSLLSEKEYDLVIVGGGLFGVCAAWEAAHRGLTVCLVEKCDFSHATSANHFKMVHGGIRYLQHGDIYRVRESSRERSAFLRIAPHLVQPLPIFIPTYGHGIKGKEFLASGVFLYDLLTCDRNHNLLDNREIPWGTFMSRRDALDHFPYLNKNGLTGGCIFCDGQMYNPPRLAISFLRSAVREGADAANYVEAIDFLQNNNRVCGIKVRDVSTDNYFEIRSKMVLNTSGAWAHRLLENNLKITLDQQPTFSRDLAFVIKSSINNTIGLACPTASGDADSILDRGGRHLFLIPWRQHTLIGVWHKVFDGLPETIFYTEEELDQYINEINTAYPGINISVSDISFVNTGLTLFGMKDKQASNKLSFGKRSQLIDHSREHNIEGLVTLIGVRVTTARGMSEKAIDMILPKLGKPKFKSTTETTPLYGGNFESFEHLLRSAKDNSLSGLKEENLYSLIRNYGSEYKNVLKYAKEDPALVHNFENSTVLKAEVIHAIREEMAQTLSDVILRRTDLGTGSHPGAESLQNCAKIMSAELGWNEIHTKKEIEKVEKNYPHF